MLHFARKPLVWEYDHTWTHWKKNSILEINHPYIIGSDNHSKWIDLYKQKDGPIDRIRDQIFGTYHSDSAKVWKYFRKSPLKLISKLTMQDRFNQSAEGIKSVTIASC